MEDALLGPGDHGLGINGIAFLGNCLYGVVYDWGRVVRIPLGRDGSAGPVGTVCEDERLVEGDGVAFDILGRLWITTNGTDVTPSGGLYRVSSPWSRDRDRQGSRLAQLPVQPVFGRTLFTATKLFVLNGAFWNYIDGSEANVIALPVGIVGLPLR